MSEYALTQVDDSNSLRAPTNMLAEVRNDLVNYVRGVDSRVHVVFSLQFVSLSVSLASREHLAESPKFYLRTLERLLGDTGSDHMRYDCHSPSSLSVTDGPRPRDTAQSASQVLFSMDKRGTRRLNWKLNDDFDFTEKFTQML